MNIPTEYLIAGGAAAAVAIAIRVVRARMKNAPPIGKHDVLMKRAAANVEKSAFLKKACADYSKTGHLSARQVEAVEKALERVDR